MGGKRLVVRKQGGDAGLPSASPKITASKDWRLSLDGELVCGREE